MGYPPALARATAHSEHLQPRDPATTARFADLIQQIFVPPLKEAGYRKKAKVWTLRGDPIWSVIDIQRKWSNSDLIQFMINWTVAVHAGQASGSSGASTRLHWSDTVVSGRVDEVLPRIRDWGYSWSIQVGWLARDFPRPVIDDPGKCEEEIANGLSRMIAFLTDLDTIGKLMSYVENVERSGRVLGARLNPERVAALRLLT
jgi:hypothetical protein